MTRTSPMLINQTGNMGGVMNEVFDLFDGPAIDTFFPPDTLLELVSFLPHSEAQRILGTPLSKMYLTSYVLNENLWKARCIEQWKVPVEPSPFGWRSLHADLVRSLTLIGGQGQDFDSDFRNVMVVLDVLDSYRTLAEIVRIGFDRLGRLMDGDDGRRAAEVADVRMMEHALWAMTSYPDDVDLQLKVLRFLVLAGRPMGSAEGMVLNRPLSNAGALRVFGPMGEGVAAVLACMERHGSHAPIQAMACWSMVNLALVTEQKRQLIRQGGILSIIQAMARHPGDREVHFRAIFSLINLVTPDVMSENSIPADTVKSVVAIVISAIEAFSNIAAIVNRGCLVLHNIALNPGHLNALVAMGAPQELLHAIGKHPSDRLLRQCATGTLQRLFMSGALDHNLN